MLLPGEIQVAMETWRMEVSRGHSSFRKRAVTDLRMVSHKERRSEQTPQRNLNDRANRRKTRALRPGATSPETAAQQETRWIC